MRHQIGRARLYSRRDFGRLALSGIPAAGLFARSGAAAVDLGRRNRQVRQVRKGRAARQLITNQSQPQRGYLRREL